QIVNGKRNGIEKFSAERSDSLLGVVVQKRFFRQIPAGERDGGFFAEPAAERENAGDERQFADGQAIDKILAPAKNGVMDFNDVVAILQHFKTNDRVGAEVIAFVIRERVSPGIVNGQ